MSNLILNVIRILFPKSTFRLGLTSILFYYFLFHFFNSPNFALLSVISLSGVFKSGAKFRQNLAKYELRNTQIYFYCKISYPFSLNNCVFRCHKSSVGTNLANSAGTSPVRNVGTSPGRNAGTSRSL
jgi:hypothetical protein